MAYEEIFTALADTTRRQIFEGLRDGPKTVGELSNTQPVSRPAVSQHLKVLLDAGLVDVEQQGTRRIHSVRKEGLVTLRDYIDSYWTDVLSAFSAEVTRTVSKKANAKKRSGDKHARSRKKNH